MATPKLKIDGKLVSIKPINDHIFEPRNINVLKSAVNSSDFRKTKFSLCLVIQDVEEEIEEFLEKTLHKMHKSPCMVFICDVGSKDNTYEKICKSKVAPRNTIVLKFDRIPIDQATLAISKIADIYSEDFPFRVVQTKIKKISSPITRKIKSFCTVSTHEVKHEVDLMIMSLREFHDQPVYILCDKETKEFLKSKKHKNLFFKVEARREELQKIKKSLDKIVKRRNSFHRPEAILKKMHCMRWAMEENSNTFFLDSDIVVVDSLQENFSHDIVLSPHYDQVGRCKNGLSYGYFNAGYIFCADKTFPDYWEYLYLNRSKFYEQEGMNYIPEKYQIGLFEKGHNVGFWRRLNTGSLNSIKNIKSFHAHFDPNIDFKGNAPLRNMNCVMVALAKDYIKENNKVLNSYIGSSKLRMSKLAFIHYGKAAGVYVNLYMKGFCTPDYNFKVSWFDGLKRDWSEDELLEILESPDERTYVHNHHINWSIKSLMKAKENGWFTFTFLRQPKDLLCSLYFWVKMKFNKPSWIKKTSLESMERLGTLIFDGASENYAKNIKERGYNLVPLTEFSLDVFIQKMIEQESKRRLWEIPPYFRELDYIAEFTEENFSNFTRVFFNHEHKPMPPRNVSGNKGYDYYRKEGLISDETESMLITDKSYSEYGRYINLK
jgi:hypothetical protein